MKKIIYIFLIFIVSCATIPTPHEVETADYGVYPYAYQEVVKNFMSETLFDPYSAIYSNWQGPSKGWYGVSNRVSFGYRVCVKINAKNRMGGYTGGKVYFFIINDVVPGENEVIRYTEVLNPFFIKYCNF